MIRELHIRGLGPHDDTRLTLDALGPNTMTGASEVGKSTLIDGICFALWGHSRDGKALPLECIRDGAEEARVTLTLASGLQLERALRRGAKGGRGQPIRQLTRRDQYPESPRREEDWLAALGKLGESPQLVRLALVPMGWLPLALGEGGGRPLRDALNAMLPTRGTRAELIAELMQAEGHRFRKGDPVNERDAGSIRAKRKVERDELAGTVKTLSSQIERLEESAPPVAPPAEESAAAEGVVRAAQAWESTAPARERAAKRRAEIEAATAAQAAWDARRAEIGDEPPVAGDYKAAEAAHSAALRAHADALGHLRELDRQIADAERAGQPRTPPQSRFVALLEVARMVLEKARAEAHGVGTTCPTCERDGWEGARARHEQLIADHAREVEDLTEQLARDVSALQADEELRQRAVRVGLDELLAKRAGAQAAVDERREAAAQAQQAVADIRAGNGPRTTWEASMRGLGARPTVPAALPAPAEPDHPCPEPAEIERARAILKARDHAAGEIVERQRTLARLQGDLAQAEEQLRRLRAEVERVEALIVAIRAEPSESVRRQLGALGDLGPVDLRLGETGGIEVYVDGRPWALASTGRQVVADVWLRLGFRRALRMAWLPLIVDCAQDVGGQSIPEIPGPSIVLVTTDDPTLTVIAGEVARG